MSEDILTVGRQLDNQRVIVVLRIIKVALDSLFVFFPKHLRALAGTQELLVVGLQSFDDTAVLLGTHLRQLPDSGDGSG